MGKKPSHLGKKLTSDEVKAFVVKSIKGNCKQVLNSENGLMNLQNVLKTWAVVLNNNYYNTDGIKEIITALDTEIIKLNAYQIDLK